MKLIVFKNSETLSSKDIYLRLTFGLIVLLLVGLVSLIQDKGQTWTIFFILSGILILIWTIKALREETLKLVEVDTENDKVSFVIEQQFKKERIIDFQLKNVSLEITTKPDRFKPINRILTIKDNNRQLTISSRQKGLSEQTLMNIMGKISTTHNTVFK